MGKTLVPPGDGGDSSEPIDLRTALEERYLAYALSTIMHRALPDVRDGLKPVHRRIVYAMREMGLRSNGSFRKCAKIVGEVMGNFHPHGDQAIYDALVRLAQDFAVRYPLVNGQGNFGNIDGDNAAAMRYTESKMTPVAELLLEGIEQDAVDFRPTYDEEGSEPVVLPGAFPNLLANGAAGIAVGMATSIPPHNAAELCDAALHLIEHPKATIEKLAEFVPGPDLPTGGIIVDSRASIIEAYTTGRGGFRVRARWHAEDTGRGGYQVVVTEIPYQVQKSRLVEKIAELLIARRLPLLDDVRDELAEDIRLVLVPKSRSVDPTLLMESLFKLTELENRVSLNMNVLSRGRVPKVMSLPEVLLEWLEHRKDVLQRRSRHRLAAIDRRLEILGGYLVAYLNIDEVIRIIREEDEPKQVMMARFGLTDLQAESILNMRLRSLRKLEEFEIRTEFDNLTSEKAGIEALLASDEKQWQTVAWEIGEVRKSFGKDTDLGTPPHRFRRRARPRSRDHPAGDDREGTDHRRRLAEGLDPRDEGASARLFRPDLQGGRCARRRLPGADDGQDPDRLDRRPGLHARRRQAAGRARQRRAAAPHGRHGQRPGRADRLRPRPGAQAALRLDGRQRLPRPREGGRRQHPQGQAGDECRAAGRGAGSACRRRAIRSPSSATTARC